MDVSVVICTYALDRYEDFSEAVESVLEQSYDSVEAIVVVDGNEAVAERVRTDFADDTVVVHNNAENRGVSYSRTKGAEIATGDVVAFIDDDAVADPDWISELVRVYEDTDALAVGGRMVGLWPAGRPSFLPVEFNWLVGVTYPGFASAGEEVRNTFESNISFRRDVFLGLDGFDPSLGPTAETYSHSEGAEIGVRLQHSHGCGVIYAPDAVVRHKVFAHRVQLVCLLRRAFEQGVSKQQLGDSADTSTGEEFRYLSYLFTTRLPQRLRTILLSPSSTGILQLLMIIVFTGVVGVGYLFGTVEQRVSTHRD